MIKPDTKNIDEVIRSLRKQLQDAPPVTSLPGLLIKEWWRTDEIDRSKYKGRGRPKDSDYVYEHYTEILRAFMPITK